MSVTIYVENSGSESSVTINQPSTEETPLIQNESKISICSSIRNSKITLTVALLASSTLAYASVIPFNETAKEFADGDVPLEYLYISCNMVGTGSLMAWGLANLILHTLPTEEGSRDPGRTCCQIFKDMILLSLIVTVSAMSRIPNIYVAAKYESNIIWPIIVTLAQTGLPILSLYKMVAAFKSFKWNPSTEEAQKEIEVQALLQAKQAIYSKNVSDLTQLALQKDDRVVFKRAVTEGISNSPEISAIKKCNRYLFQTIGFATVVGSFIYKGKLSYEFAEELWANQYFQITFATLCVGPTAYLSIDVTNLNFKALADLLSCNNPKKEVPLAYYPLSTLTLKMISAAIGILTFPSVITVSRDEFGFDNAFGIFVGGAAVVNTALLSGNAMGDLVDLLLKPVIEKIGNQKAKLAIQLHKAIDKEIASLA